jgi:RNA recognition motif-containing protein
LASKTLYVGNLNYNTMEQALAELFAGQGHVVDVRIMMGKGFGFVEMASEEEATKAKEALNGVQLDGRTIRVDEARPRRGQEPREERPEKVSSTEEGPEEESSTEEGLEEESSTEESPEEESSTEEGLEEESSSEDD